MQRDLVLELVDEVDGADSVGVFTTAASRDEIGYDPGLLDRLGFSGAEGEVVSLPASATTIDTLVGLPDEVTLGAIRSAAARFVAGVSAHQASVLDVAPLVSALGEKGFDRAAVAVAIAEGLVLGDYRFTDFKTEPTDVVLERVGVVGLGHGSDVAAAFERGRIVATAQCRARDWVNTPGGTLTPPAFADIVATMARAEGIDVAVWGPDEIRAERLGGLLAVNQGSAHEPRFVRLRYRPSGRRAKGGPSAATLAAAPRIALVGKGLTFDSGGLSLKPAEAMMTMKMDMGGAAACAAAVIAAAQLRLPVDVNAYLALTDNMTGPAAQRPGDVFTARNGTTVEVLNTDAEGRLVLADALAVAADDGAEMIVDVATLTGACMVALGTEIAGVLGQGEAVNAVQAAADAVGERVWPLPIPDDYARQLESPVADLKNIGTRYGGAITAALFLSRFVGKDAQWAHLDIAGPAYNDGEAQAEIPKGGTGFGVRTLVELIASR